MAMISGKVAVGGAVISGNIVQKSGLSGKIEKPDSIYVKEVEFKSRLEFPNIGAENMLYIATDEHSAYIFDTEENVYRCVGRDYNEIDAIQCRLKED